MNNTCPTNVNQFSGTVQTSVPVTPPDSNDPVLVAVVSGKLRHLELFPMIYYSVSKDFDLFTGYMTAEAYKRSNNKHKLALWDFQQALLGDLHCPNPITISYNFESVIPA